MYDGKTMMQKKELALMNFNLISSCASFFILFTVTQHYWNIFGTMKMSIENWRELKILLINFCLFNSEFDRDNFLSLLWRLKKFSEIEWFSWKFPRYLHFLILYSCQLKSWNKKTYESCEEDVKMIRKEWKAVLRPLYLIENVRGKCSTKFTYNSPTHIERHHKFDKVWTLTLIYDKDINHH